MSSESAPAPPPQTFHVEYQSGSSRNRDLTGAGELTVRDGTFAFYGAGRGSMFNGPAKTITFQRDQIRNVVRVDAGVQFDTTTGKSGEKKVPFLFFCTSAAQAAAVAALLPDVKDEGFIETRSFQQKLRELSPAGGVAGYVTNWIIVANVAAFVVMGCFGAGWIETKSMRPYVVFAANNGAATTDGEWWRLVTCMFAHYGLMHLLLNMWALFQVGHLVEKLLGRALFTMMYFGSGIIGGFATLLWHGDRIWSAGASGAIFGVYGALLGYLWREKHGMPKSVLQPMVNSTLVFAGYNLVYGAAHPHIDNMAHLGGLAGGVLFGWVCALPLDREIRARQTRNRLAVGAGVLAAALLVGMAATPRYDYSIRDELRWENAMTGRGKEEDSLVETGRKVLTSAGDVTDRRFVAYVRDSALPFYERWRAELKTLPLEPGKVTARQRDALVHLFDLKLKSYRGLLAAVNRHDPTAASTYAAEQSAIALALADFNRQMEASAR